MAGKKTRTKYTIRDAQELAETRGGSCLSNEWVSSQTKLKWECSKGHIWEATWNNVKSKNSWCFYCSPTKKKSISDMKKLAVKRGGKCLSKKYVNWKTKLKWKCENGHVWWACQNSIHNGTWCPHCTVNYMEEKCRYIFESILKVSFLRQKLPEGLELDGFNEAKNIAFEYNGKQHYEYSRFFHRTPHDFVKQQQRDKQKSTICDRRDIHLIVVPYICKTDIELVNFISKSLNIKPPKLSFDDFYQEMSPLTMLRKLAESKGGRLVSEYYDGTRSKLEWECKHGHTWWARPCNIKEGVWCPYCSRNAHWSLSDIKKFAEDNNCSCLSLEYKNAKTYMDWSCKICGHQWTTSYDQVRRKWCLNCEKSRRI